MTHHFGWNFSKSRVITTENTWFGSVHLYTGWSYFLFTRQDMMENIIGRTVKDEVERRLSPSSTPKKEKKWTRMANLLDKIRNGDHLHEDKLRKVHITWKRVCFVRNQELCHKKGGQFCFAYLPLNATVDTLSKKAIDVFFPEGTNASGEMREHCSLRFTDSAENIVSPATQIKVCLEKSCIYHEHTLLFTLSGIY